MINVLDKVTKWFNGVIQAEVAKQVVINQQATNNQPMISNPLGTGSHQPASGQQAASDQAMTSLKATTRQDAIKKAAASGQRMIGKLTQEVCELGGW